MMKIVIAEDQGMLRGAMSTLLSMEEDIEVVGQAGDGEEALRLILSLDPDLCVMDIEMPVLSGLDVAERLKAEGSRCRVVIVTTFARTGYFQRAIRAGVQGYLLKDAPVSDLAGALHTIHAGGRVISPELAYSMWEQENPLTEREQDILRHLAQGSTVGEISGALFLSPGTVRNYISEIMQKLEAKNRIDAVAIAQNKGWIEI
ncbi:two-component system response regulator [Paenibacillus elgii]|uniref:Two-component system response regulator n=1 Tax=Paenibacillus elgii TaxID=189691 RepID=A0A163X027_9BACL|nr:response regulator transcription factor [Paenibacillus elgii]KZE77107.1 two-component system response regulator [Paenibacillus elgii]